MVYEVCALVITIILGVIGLELMLWLRSARKFVNEAEQTVRTVNARLPEVVDDMQAMSSLVRKTTEQVGGTVNEVAVGFDELRKNPLSFVTKILLDGKQLLELWKEIRGRINDEAGCEEERQEELNKENLTEKEKVPDA